MEIQHLFNEEGIYSRCMSDRENIKAVCFDWGNTIQLGKPGIVETILHMWQKFRPGSSDTDILHAAQMAWCELAAVKPNRRQLGDPLFFRQELWAKQADLMAKELKFNSDIPDWPWVANAFFRDYYYTNRSWSVPDSHARLLYKLKKIDFPMAVIANDDDSAGLPRTISELGLTGYFETEIASSSFGRAKPHSSIYLAALDCLDLRADEVLFVGDDFHNDYWGPQQVGMFPVIFDPDGLYANVENIIRIERLDNILDFLPERCSNRNGTA